VPVVFVVLALAAGLALPIQAAINAQLRTVLGNPFRASFFQFLIGSLVLFAVTLTIREPWPSLAEVARGPWYAWVGGFLGAFYITCAIVVVPRLGAGLTFALVVAGQMAASLAIDQFGFLGLPATPISLTRTLGAALLVAGVILVRR
jgi:transporter family-2 protein